MPRRGRIPADEITGFLDHGTAVTGELRFSGTLRIDGDFHGSISTDGVLAVGENAELYADIRAAEVEVYGRVSGTIEAARRVHIHSAGRVKADVRTPVLVIEDGGSLLGRSRGWDEGAAGAAAPVRLEDLDEVPD